jgi:hypothetical protein
MGELREERQSDSLTPVAVETGNIDQELAAMNGSNRGRLMAFLAVLLVAVGASGIWLSGIDRVGNYREAGKALNGLKRSEFDKFWNCALQGVDLREIKSNTDLVGRIQERSRANPVTYARQIRDRCLETLVGIEAKLDAGLFPTDLGEPVIGMKNALVSMRTAWNEYVAYLTNSSSEFDEYRAKLYENRIAEGWYGFSKVHGEINRLLRTKLK